MGLLAIVTAKIRRAGLGPRIVKFLPLISLICALIGVLWLAKLPMEGQFRRTYISENALLPHQADTHFRESEWNLLRGFRQKVRDVQTRPDPLAEIQSILETNVGLKTASDDWGNIYAIMHAPRGSQSEAVVLVAPWNAMDGEFNDGGVSLLIALSRFFKKRNIWHKNLVYVIPHDGHASLRHWIEAYHSTLPDTAGSIEGAIVLDYSGKNEHFDHIDVLFDGLNGEQPNLDLVNVAIMVSEAEWVRAEVCESGSAHNQYEQRLRTMMTGIWNQVFSGVNPRGPGSEMFSGWRIDAITLRARGESGPVDITYFGRVAESLVRSVNNLLEHFHQSFFFYLLLGPHYFVSIGTYLPAAMLIANSFPIMAIYIFSIEKQVSFMSILGFSAIWFSSIGAGWLSKNMAAWIMLVPVVISTFLHFVMTNSQKQSMHALALVLYGLALTTLAMLNFSLSFALGLVSSPLAWVRPASKISFILVALCCPLSFLFLAQWVTGSPANEIFFEVLASQELGVWTWPLIVGLWFPVWLVSLAVS